MWVDLAQLRQSRLQQALQWLSLIVVAALLWLSGLAWPFKAVVLFALAVLSVVYGHVQQRQIRLYTLQQHDRLLWQWQQVTLRRTRAKKKHRCTRDTAQIQARLLRVEAWLGVVVILHFEVIALGQRQTWLIWRDQVDMDNWRRLQVLQQYWSAPLQ